ncbi:hypothetical protein BaRGS_00007875 [Batillaria attramentaria]|uniref:Uncharacterized protein n=1 Tax=Batillaria attramentaria TaxID=370345 RepID=A0ABD0LNG5_9CAEN
MRVFTCRYCATRVGSSAAGSRWDVAPLPGQVRLTCGRSCCAATPTWFYLLIYLENCSLDDARFVLDMRLARLPPVLRVIGVCFCCLQGRAKSTS